MIEASVKSSTSVATLLETNFDETCNNSNDTAAKFERVTVALSHPTNTNLKDELTTSAKLHQPVGQETFTFHPDN